MSNSRDGRVVSAGRRGVRPGGVYVELAPPAARRGEGRGARAPGASPSGAGE